MPEHVHTSVDGFLSDNVYAIFSAGNYRTHEELQIAQNANLIIQVENGVIKIIKDKQNIHTPMRVTDKHITMLSMGLLPAHIKEEYIEAYKL